MSAWPDEGSVWSRGNFCSHVVSEYALTRQQVEDVALACSSAWAWLEANGFIARRRHDDAWCSPTIKGKAMLRAQDLRDHLAGDRLAAADLHPELLIHTRPLYLQARFETAVFEAFKALEVAIRDAAGLGHDLVGVQLAGRAFQPESGPLAHHAAERGEQVR